MTSLFHDADHDVISPRKVLPSGKCKLGCKHLYTNTYRVMVKIQSTELSFHIKVAF